jgi:uncharacterized membrane protein (DUF373 family)
MMGELQRVIKSFLIAGIVTAADIGILLLLKEDLHLPIRRLPSNPNLTDWIVVTVTSFLFIFVMLEVYRRKIRKK